MKRLMLVVAAVAALAAGAGRADAADWPDPTFDQIATEVAGHPVHVWCEDDDRLWDSIAYDNLDAPGEWLGGFTNPANPVVYLAPWVCRSLHLALEAGYRDAGLFYSIEAIHILDHEAAHQRGITDEHDADCTALPLDVPIAVKYFHVPETVKVARTETYTKKIRVKVKKTTVVKTVTATRVVYDTVPNPELQRMQQWDQALHDSMGAPYSGACT